MGESPEELREALAGVEALDVIEWRRETKLRGVFKDAPKHKVVEWFWSYVATLSHTKKAELLRWATGSARCPLGGFAKLHGRDGVETFHADVGGAGAVRVPARAYVLQPHRPAFIQLSARPGGRVRRCAGPAARRGVFDGLIRVYF